jgi:hypothetical protein
MHLSLILDMAADALGDRPAVTAPDGTITFVELRERADALAGSLAGERVVQLGLNSLAVPVTLFAAARAGAAFTPLNYRLADPDLVRMRPGPRRRPPSSTTTWPPRLATVDGLDVIETEALGGVARRTSCPTSTPTTRRSCCSPPARPVSRRRPCCGTATSRRT